jgi:hypothetical protein
VLTGDALTGKLRCLNNMYFSSPSVLNAFGKLQSSESCPLYAKCARSKSNKSLCMLVHIIVGICFAKEVTFPTPPFTFASLSRNHALSKFLRVTKGVLIQISVPGGLHLPNKQLQALSWEWMLYRIKLFRKQIGNRSD